jgi:hypothetical protein
VHTTHRIVGIGALVAGLVLAIGTFAVGGFRSAAAGERLLDLSRPELTEEGLAALRADFTTASTLGSEIGTQLFPLAAGAEGLTLEAYLSGLATRYPALAASGAESTETLTFTDRAITNLEAHQEDFERADDLPVPGVPLTVAPYVTLALGVVLLVAGAVLLRGRGGSGVVPVWIVAATGVLLIGSTLVTGTPGKVAAADRLIDSLNITSESAQETRARLEVQVAGAAELEGRFLPELREQLGLTDAAFRDLLVARTPTVAATVGRIPALIERFEVDVRIREDGHDEFAAIEDVPIRALPWLYIVSGAIALLAAASALAALRGVRRRATGTTPAAAAATGGAATPAATAAGAGPR